MAKTLRLIEEERDAPQQRTALDDAPARDTAPRGAGECPAEDDHTDRVAAAAGLIMRNHADALRRLGE